MCGRATLAVPGPELRITFDLVEAPEDVPPRFNIAPSQPLAVMRAPGRLELVRWGARERGGFINVRLETAPRRPANRCLVVVDGFYEWRTGDRQPFYFHRRDGKAFTLGGVLRGDACAIVTCPAEPGIVELHDRMPLVLAGEGRAAWLEGAKPTATLAGLERHAVSRFVNVAKNDDARCIAPIELPGATWHADDVA